MTVLDILSVLICLIALKVYGPYLPKIADELWIDERWVKVWVIGWILFSFVPIMNTMIAIVSIIMGVFMFVFKSKSKTVGKITTFFTGKRG